MTSFLYDDCEYTRDDLTPIVKLLTDDPSELVVYQEKTLKMCDILLDRQAYSNAVEMFVVMCRVLAAVHTALNR